eukprot:scaffold182756_cov42-Cyclotella_meneghiniana.AAC.1
MAATFPGWKCVFETCDLWYTATMKQLSRQKCGQTNVKNNGISLNTRLCLTLVLRNMIHTFVSTSKRTLHKWAWATSLHNPIKTPSLWLLCIAKISAVNANFYAIPRTWALLLHFDRSVW